MAESCSVIADLALKRTSTGNLFTDGRTRSRKFVLVVNFTNPKGIASRDVHFLDLIVLEISKILLYPLLKMATSTTITLKLPITNKSPSTDG